MKLTEQQIVIIISRLYKESKTLKFKGPGNLRNCAYLLHMVLDNFAKNHPDFDAGELEN